MRINKPLAVAVLCTLTASSHVLAQEERYVDIMPFITRVDEDRLTERQAWGLRGAYGWGWGGNWFSEVQLFGTQLDSASFIDPLAVPDYTLATPYSDLLITSGDLEVSGLGFDVVYSFNGRNGYSPYVLGGVGVSNNNYKSKSLFVGEDESNGFLNLALGITSGGIGPHGLKVRAELRYLRDYFADEMDDWQLGLGLSIPLSCPPVAAAVVAAPPPEPKPEIINTDGDGDGVLDRNDRCPDTLPGAEVDEYGCVVANQTITLENIQFEFNSARLTPAAEGALGMVIQSLRNQPGSQVEVAGHTDSRGNDDYNLRLSRERAQSVRNYLVRGGIDANRISAMGYGETQPVASNATDAGRAQNRRVEMRFR